MPDSKRVVSLFSGCGGLDFGFSNAGYEIVYATDYNGKVKRTYEANHDAELVVKDIRDLDLTELPDCDGIIGAPPCQSWSLAGNHLRGTEDERGEVIYDYLDAIETKQPRFFVFENVPGLISKRNIDEFELLLDKFDEIGYSVQYEKLDASYYGVPQSRKRVILVGIRNDLDYDYEFPGGSTEPTTQQDSHLDELPPSKPTEKEPRTDLDVPNHEHYMGSWSSRFMSRQRVRNWDEPAYTVQANARHQRIHPKAPKMERIERSDWEFKDGYEDEYRRYSVREAAILQTFPDDFVFHYDNIHDGYKMVGNAVPVKLAEAIADSIELD